MPWPCLFFLSPPCPTTAVRYWKHERHPGLLVNKHPTTKVNEQIARITCWHSSFVAESDKQTDTHTERERGRLWLWIYYEVVQEVGGGWDLDDVMHTYRPYGSLLNNLANTCALKKDLNTTKIDIDTYKWLWKVNTLSHWILSSCNCDNQYSQILL